MATMITMTRAQYDALMAAAEGDTQVDVPSLKAMVDQANGITRYVLYIRWQDLGGSPPTRIEIANGTGWPPDQTFRLTQEHPISRQDVDQVIATQATNPVGPTVTPDPEGIVGWTELGVYDFDANAA